MPIEILALKLVVTIETTRTNAQIEQRLRDYYPFVRQKLQDLADSDPETTIADWAYLLKFGDERSPGTNIKEIYPKLVVWVDTTRTRQQIMNRLQPHYAGAQQYIRDEVASDPNTSIIEWHYHLDIGSCDEDEATGEKRYNE